MRLGNTAVQHHALNMDMREFMNLVENAKVIRVYRGEYSGNRGGRFWTQDKEFARQFTQSGQDREILVRYMHTSDIKDCSHVYAGDPDVVDAEMEIAKEEGYKALLLNEGRGEPNSIWVFDRSALSYSAIASSSRNTAKLQRGH